MNLVKSNQRVADHGALDCSPFIDFMRDAIANSLGEYRNVMTQIASNGHFESIDNS